MKPNAKTHNGALAFEHTENSHLEFFAKAGSLFDKKQSYYGNESTALDLFKGSWRGGDYETSMKLLCWLRDIRGVGAGNRSGFRSCIAWLAESPVGAKWVEANIALIPELGRWDDLKALYGTPCEKAALTLWASALTSEGAECGLASKWANRQDYKLRNHMGMAPKTFRKMLVANTKVIESSMCAKAWGDITYEHVPSVAMARYKKAFYKNDQDRFEDYRQSLVKVNEDGTTELTGEVKAGALFPHDIIRMLLSDSKLSSMDLYYGKAHDVSNGTMMLAEGQFLSLPDYYNITERRVMPFVDCSASMSAQVSGSITAMAVALGLGLYCSDRLGKENPFYRKFMPFSNHAEFKSWDGKMFGETVLDNYGRGFCGGTNIHAAFDLLLDGAKMFNATPEQMPNVVVILSDQQFDRSFRDSDTPVNSCLAKWVEAGYEKPEVIYWNLAGYGSTPATMHDTDVGMVSGFSPSILKSFLGGDKLDPISVMKRTLEEYEVTVPKG